MLSTDTAFTRSLLAVVALLKEKYWSALQGYFDLVRGAIRIGDLAVVCNIVPLHQSLELICLFLHFVSASCIFRYELSISMVQLNSLSVTKEMRSVIEVVILSPVGLFFNVNVTSSDSDKATPYCFSVLFFGFVFF